MECRQKSKLARKTLQPIENSHPHQKKLEYYKGRNEFEEMKRLFIFIAKQNTSRFSIIGREGRRDSVSSPPLLMNDVSMKNDLAA